MKLLVIVCVSFLAGCAGLTPQQAQERLPHLSDFQVCQGAILAPAQIASLSQGEANRRGLDCAQYASAIMQQRANQNQAVQNYINSLNPPVQPMRQPTNCRTVRIGNGWETMCH